MNSMLPSASELDAIDDFLEDKYCGDFVEYYPKTERPTSVFQTEARSSWKEFDPHFLDMTDLKNYPGPFGFEVTVAEYVNQRRAKPYVYSPELRRLYSVSFEQVAFTIKTSSEIPNDCSVYAFTLYSDQVFRAENVVTCDHHSAKEESLKNFCGKVFLRAGNGLNVTYRTLGTPARDVMQFPLPPSPGNQVIPLKFMCRNSCPGAINRRATKLVLVLCNNSNDILGVSVIDFRIVSVPNRDCAREVQRLNGLPPRVKTLPSKKPRSETEASSDSEEYVIRVRGAMNYRMLKTVAEGLETRRKFRKEQKKTKVPEPDLIL